MLFPIVWEQMAAFQKQWLQTQVLTNFQRQYDYYKSEFDASGSEGKFKQPESEVFDSDEF